MIATAVAAGAPPPRRLALCATRSVGRERTLTMWRALASRRNSPSAGQPNVKPEKQRRPQRHSSAPSTAAAPLLTSALLPARTLHTFTAANCAPSHTSFSPPRISQSSTRLAKQIIRCFQFGHRRRSWSKILASDT